MIKSLILERLHNLTEAPKRATTSDYLRTTFRVSILTQQHKHDDYFMGEDNGEFIAAAIVDIRGNVRISQVAKVPAGDLKNNRLGITRDTKDYLQFYVMAGRGIQHPDTEKQLPDETAMTRQGVHSPTTLPTYTKTVHLNHPMQADGQIIKTIDVEVPKPGSPASDAQIKTYLLYGPMIIDFVEKNLDTPIGYQDGKAPEIRNQMELKKKIEIIRKDAEDYLNKHKLQRINLIQTFEDFKTQFITPLSNEEKMMLDTTSTTKAFIKYYLEKNNIQQKPTLSTPDADDVLQRQAAIQKKIDDMKARRNRN